jgi:hypothetical protein
MTSPKEWAEFERLQDFLKSYDLGDILAATSEQAWNEAANLRAAGYPETALKLEYLADVLGSASIPEVRVHC